MDSKKTGENKDHLSPTPNNKKETEKPNSNLSHEELQEKLNLYSTVNRDEKPVFSILALKQKYLKEIEAKEANRNKGAIHYSQGRRSGLPHPDYEDIKDAHDQDDRKLRNDVAKEAKAKYQVKNSLSKSFKDKEKDMDV